MLLTLKFPRPHVWAARQKDHVYTAKIAQAQSEHINNNNNLITIIFHIYIAHFLYNTQMWFTTLLGGLCLTANAVYN